MAGHSKWAQIKHKKAHTDAKRGKVFTKLVKEISVAARMGGGDPAGNPRLRTAIDAARGANMPMDNIKKAIMKGTGELPGTSYEEVTYEGYGPGGAAILIAAVTDNRNRTVSELRHIMGKHNGNLGEAGCVGWMFDKQGYILVNKEAVDEDTLMSISLEAGALDMKNDGGEQSYEIICEPEDLSKVQEALLSNKIATDFAEITMLPKNYTSLEGQDAEQMAKLLEAIEDNDDVQNVYSNADIPDEILEQTA